LCPPGDHEEGDHEEGDHEGRPYKDVAGRGDPVGRALCPPKVTTKRGDHEEGDHEGRPYKDVAGQAIL